MNAAHILLAELETEVMDVLWECGPSTVNVGRVFLKAEWERPLGNFKVLGGMLAGRVRSMSKACARFPIDLRSFAQCDALN